MSKFSRLSRFFDSKKRLNSNQKLTTELDAEVKGLKKELLYYQNAIYEIGQKKMENDHASAHCQDGFGIAKCQVFC